MFLCIGRLNACGGAIDITNVTASVTRSENNIQKLSNDRDTLSKEQKALESFDEDKSAKPLTDRIDKLQKDTNENIRNLLKQRDELLSQLADQKTAQLAQLQGISSTPSGDIDGQIAGSRDRIKELETKIQNERTEARNAVNAYRNVIKQRNNDKVTALQNLRNEQKENRESIDNKISSEREKIVRINKNSQERITLISNEAVEQKDKLNNSESEALKNCGFFRASCSEIRKQFQKQRSDIESDKNKQITEINRNRTTRTESLTKQISSLEQQRTALDSAAPSQSPNLEKVDASRLEELTAGPESRIAEFEKEIALLNAQISNLSGTKTGLLQRAEAEQKKIVQQIDQRIQDITDDYRDRINDEQEAVKAPLNSAKNELKELQKTFKQNRGRIPNIKDAIGKINIEINEEKEKKRKEAERNNIYRMTALIYGIDDVVEVSKDQLKIVAGIWFGSISLLAATIGTILALISFILRDPQAFEEKQRFRGAKLTFRLFRLSLLRVSSFLRSLIVLIGAITGLLFALPTAIRGVLGRKVRIALRIIAVGTWRRYRKPKIVEKIVTKEVEVVKEVVKEVPVDRVVTSEVVKEVPIEKVVTKEVPVEVYRDRVVHVPIASDDLTILDIEGQKNDAG